MLSSCSWLARLVSLLVVLALPLSAAGQVKGQIYILFDTSGSMLRSSQEGVYAGPCGPPPQMACNPPYGCWQYPSGYAECLPIPYSIGDDGSPLCVDGLGVYTRLFVLKEALFDVLQGVGHEEIDFALATFPQRVDATRVPKCPRECLDASQGGPCGGHYYTDNAMVQEYNATGRYSCKISTHAPAVDIGGACNDDGDCAAARFCDPEARRCILATADPRADCGHSSNPCGSWYDQFKVEVLRVPFGQPPEEMLAYFDQLEDGDSDPVLDNPEVRAAFNWFTPLGKSLFYAYGYFDKEVVLPAGDYRKKCQRISVAFFTDGGETCNANTRDKFYPTSWAQKLKDDLQVVTHTVGIDVTVPLLPAIADAGGGSYTNVQGNIGALKKAFLDIIAKSRPPSEICNGEDDDCDGQVDEDFPLKGQSCDNGLLGACFETGTYQCTTDGLGVECTAGPKTGTDEICNGIDDNCDGAIDNKPGGCPICVPQPEVCNGEDDNCNGEVDEGLPTDLPCGTEIGICTAGTSRCDSDLGKWVCEGGSGPADQELCNNLDDDCDGLVDGMLESCYPFASGCDLEAGTCQGICRLGARLCTEGDWGSCQGAIGPEDEICNGIDDDCDGSTDEEAECPAGSQCVEGACTRPCGTGEFQCPSGQICKNNWCVTDTCDAVECNAKGWICKSGECIDPCANVTCGPLEECVKGACVDTSCYAEGCPPGQRCVQGACVADPCAGVSCAADEFCHDGDCLTLCDAQSCPDGQVCKLVADSAGASTRCVDDPCADITCDSGWECVDGRCEVEPCSGVYCDKGQICHEGSCVEDLCEKTRCPTAYRCELGQCVPAASTTDNLLATGAGGLTCTVGTSDGDPPLLLLLLGALLLRGRRGTPDVKPGRPRR